MLWLQVCNWQWMAVVALAAPDQNTETEQRMPISSDLLTDCQSLYCDAAAIKHKNMDYYVYAETKFNLSIAIPSDTLKRPTQQTVTNRSYVGISGSSVSSHHCNDCDCVDASVPLAPNLFSHLSCSRLALKLILLLILLLQLAVFNLSPSKYQK